jgi:capsular polysaccharide biosynthesis protein
VKNESDQADILPVETPTANRSADEDITLEEFEVDEEFAAVDRGVAFASMGFIGAAVRRGALLWCVTALAGLLIGLGMYAKFPPAYQASTTLLVFNNPNYDAENQSADNVSVAQSEPVAEAVIRQLGLNQTVTSLIKSYTVTAPSADVLVITADAPTSQGALQRASALASAFLSFRANMLQTQQQLSDTALEQQVSSAQQRVDTLDTRIREAESTKPAQLPSLRKQLNYADATLTAAEQNATTQQASTQTVTSQMVNNSQVLDAASPLKPSLKKGIVFYAGVALLAGLAIGMAIVIVRALVSDRLRYRSEVAEVIGAPVALSVGPVRRRSLLPRRKAELRAARERVARYLDSAAGSASLAVIVVDEPEEAARAVASLARFRVSHGKRVVVADLSAGSTAARLLGVAGEGVHTAAQNLVVAVPDQADIAPVGPHKTEFRASAALTSAYDSADLFLTFAELDPAIGADHLASWASDAVAVVTAGKSSVTKIQAAGAMIRLAGVHLVSAVLIGAYPDDESLGMPTPADDAAPIV